jgi:hypothetical protein
VTLLVAPSTNEKRTIGDEAWFRQIVQSVNGIFQPKPPVHDNSTGVPNTFSYDGSYLYICVSKNKWLRVAISGGW